MTTIFLSYRRDDSAGHAGRLYDELEAVYGADRLFRDVDSIRPGDDFREVLARHLGVCEVLLAVIGPRWATSADDAGRLRLHDPGDYVRIEIAAALRRRDVRVLPVLVHDAEVPGALTLPEDLRPLAVRQAIELRDTRWEDDVHHLVDAMGRPPGPLHRLLRRYRWQSAVALLGVAAAAIVLALFPDEPPPSSPSPSEAAAQTAAPPSSAPRTAAPAAAPLPGTVRINFQASDASTPQGFTADVGQPFGEATVSGPAGDLRYGWVRPGTSEPKDMTAHARDRNAPSSPSQEFDTLLHFVNTNSDTGEVDHADWALQLPEGRYRVTVTAGDPRSATDEERARERHTVAVEGVAAITDFRASEAGSAQETATITVPVDDGLLTLSSPGDLQTKISSVKVAPAP